MLILEIRPDPAPITDLHVSKIIDEELVPQPSILHVPEHNSGLICPDNQFDSRALLLAPSASGRVDLEMARINSAPNLAILIDHCAFEIKCLRMSGTSYQK
ncbi:hypothetical protein [Erythrobacter sp. SG61-1L]|uniref:hypothetical protein n=1 Tax=Erythrobacter sp. SG61-1L TaxID=1603897 RepID=UPI000ADDA3B3|nr:hypothetical protein [Erythrobacter sp. SG61-1L]